MDRLFPVDIQSSLASASDGNRRGHAVSCATSADVTPPAGRGSGAARTSNPVDQTELDEIRIDRPKPEAGRVGRHLPPVMAAVKYQMKQDVSHW